MWLVQVPYETLNGEAKMMQSAPLEREDAEHLRAIYRGFGHQTNLVDVIEAETKEPTAIHAKTRVGKDVALPTERHAFYAALARRGVCDLSFAGLGLGAYTFFGIEFDQADFKRCDLQGAEFTGAALGEVDLCDAQAQGAKFDHAVFTKVKADEGCFEDATFERAHFTNGSFERARAAGAVFDGALFTATALVHADLAQTSWCGATLKTISMGHADLSGADLSGAKLEGTVNLTCANLTRIVNPPPRLAAYAVITEAEPLIQGASRVARDAEVERLVDRPGATKISLLQIAVQKLWLDHAATGGSLLMQEPREAAEAAIAIAKAISAAGDLDAVCRVLGERGSTTAKKGPGQ
jgi:uncharacterized protein YjbI with pentapeptide repeats